MVLDDGKHPAVRQPMASSQLAKWSRLSPLLLAAALAGCGGSGSKIQATPQGVFYSDWIGNLFQVLDGRLVRVKPDDSSTAAPRTLTFTESIPDVADGPFPALVSGSLKIGHGFRRYKIDLVLTGANGKNPTVAEQQKFISDLVEGNGRLRAVVLNFIDADGFLASDDKAISITSDGWTRVSNPSGGGFTRLTYLSREPSGGTADAEIQTIAVKWNSLDKPTPAPVVAPYPTPDPPSSPPNP